MAILTQHRPDPKYYTNIIQHDDGNWSSDPLPVDDYAFYPGMHIPAVGSTTSRPPAYSPGLRSLTSVYVRNAAQALVNLYAPADYQRNWLYVLKSQTIGSPAYNAAKAAMDWVAAVNTYRDQQIAYVKTLNFNQLVVYVVAAGAPPYPAPPAGLTPVPPAPPGSAVARLRYG